jgi:hypothetical protein
MPDDGTVQVPISNPGVETMPADLPPGVANQLMTESVGNIMADNRRGRDGATITANTLNGMIVREYGEVGVLEGRAVSGVNATPIASPATQAPAA